MVDIENPYALYIEVLSYRYSGAHHIALTGQMVAMHAELNHLFGRSKGQMPPESWAKCADDWRGYFELYESAWNQFSSSLGDPDAYPRPGVEVADAFQSAVDGARQVLERMRREFAEAGKESWIF
jgi:hypothetical protein